MATAFNQRAEVGRDAFRFYLPELDTLRFFAFLAVFIMHVFFALGLSSTILNMGRFGVDLFFTLSAFLITELMMREKETLGHLDVRSFYARRILRIWPLYFAFLGAVFITLRIYPLVQIPSIYFISFALFVGNFAQSLLPVQPSAVIGPLWSVSVEEQFYLSWPLLVRYLSRRGVGILAIAIWLLSICVRWVLVSSGASHWAVDYCTFSRLDPIACGLLLSALVGRARPGWLARLRPELFLAGVLFWLAAAACLFHFGQFYLTNPLLVTIGFPAVALGCGAFMLATMGTGSVMRNRQLMYLGRISYGLYVYHGTMVMLSVALLGSLSGWFRLVACHGCPSGDDRDVSRLISLAGSALFTAQSEVSILFVPPRPVFELVAARRSRDLPTSTAITARKKC